MKVRIRSVFLFICVCSVILIFNGCSNQNGEKKPVKAAEITIDESADSENVDGFHPLWLRYPAISPDGKWIAFSYKGNIYKVASKGGLARPLTIGGNYNFSPVWSPDSKFIAFASDKYGDFDIFYMPFTGGAAKRLTYYSANDFPWSFTPDGKSILFSSSRVDNIENVQFPSRSMTELYKVSVDGKTPEMVFSVPAENAVMSGNKIFYHDKKGYEDEWRKHHTSSNARNIWVYDTREDSFTRLTNFKGEDRNPLPVKDGSGIYYLSEQSGSFNVWKMALNAPDKAVQITKFDTNPVRFLTVSDNGTLCFGYDGEIYTLNDGAAPAKVNVTVAEENGDRDYSVYQFAQGASEFAISPNGKETAFVYRGDVYITSNDYDDTKRITRTDAEERNIDFSPDGRSIVYASMRDGSWNVYKTSIENKKEPYFFSSSILKEEIVVDSDKNEFQPSFSPDGKEIAYLENRTELKVYNIKSKETRTVLPKESNFSYEDGDQYYTWSPDSNFFLVQYLGHERWSTDIGLVNASGKEPVINITNSGYENNYPIWSKDGSFFTWLTDRNGKREHGTVRMPETDIYIQFLEKKAYDKMKLSKADLEVLKATEKPDFSNKKLKLKPETDELENKRIRLTETSGLIKRSIPSLNGETIYYIVKSGKNYILASKDIRDRTTKIITSVPAAPGGFFGSSFDFKMDPKGMFLIVLSGGTLTKIDLPVGLPKPITWATDFNYSPEGERDAMFDHVWRTMKDKFYREDMQGVDWEKYGKIYKKFLPYIDNNYDFSEMLSEMLGELNASHTGSGYINYSPDMDYTGKLGIFFTLTDKGMKIDEIIEKSPLDKEELKISKGMTITKVNGINVAEKDNIFALFNRTVGFKTAITLLDEKEKEFTVIIKPISTRDENHLLYKRWVKSREKETEKLSEGKLGYIHVEGMDDGSFRTTFEKLLGKYNEKEGIIIDTRFNGGGWLHDQLATLLSGTKYMRFNYRGQKNFGSEPLDKWTKRSVVIVSEGNYSDAHMFPVTYRELGLGKIVGMPVPGTGTAVWWELLQNGRVYYGIPQVGMIDNKEQYLENQELVPDVIQDNLPGEMIKGKDSQLEAAVKELLSEQK